VREKNGEDIPKMGEKGDCLHSRTRGNKFNSFPFARLLWLVKCINNQDTKGAPKTEHQRKGKDGKGLRKEARTPVSLPLNYEFCSTNTGISHIRSTDSTHRTTLSANVSKINRFDRFCLRKMVFKHINIFFKDLI